MLETAHLANNLLHFVAKHGFLRHTSSLIFYATTSAWIKTSNTYQSHSWFRWSQLHTGTRRIRHWLQHIAQHSDMDSDHMDFLLNDKHCRVMARYQRTCLERIVYILISSLILYIATCICTCTCTQHYIVIHVKLYSDILANFTICSYEASWTFACVVTTDRRAHAVATVLTRVWVTRRT